MRKGRLYRGAAVPYRGQMVGRARHRTTGTIGAALLAPPGS
jgi:hypothetical protein